jgi:DNA-binding transcriptional ArsR family regulator
MVEVAGSGVGEDSRIGRFRHHTLQSVCRLISISTIPRVCFMSQLSASALAQVADYFKVLSELSRLQVLCALKSGTKNVSEIMDATGLGQANVSKHLKVLAQAGMVKRQPYGVSVYYEIADPSIFDLCEIVCQGLENRLNEQSQQLQQLEILRQPSSN